MYDIIRSKFKGDVLMPKRMINMLSRADTVEGQGVSSAYRELVSLVENNLSDKYDLSINKFKFKDISHYHTINLEFFLSLPVSKMKSATIGYVHFLPETLDNSIKLPKPVKAFFYNYVMTFYKSMDYLVTVNPYFIDRLESYGVNRDKVTYIPNYVSKKRFFKLNENEIKNIKNEYNIDSSKFTVLCVGQLQKRKGIFDFIEVAKKMPDVQFVWAGGFSFKKISDGYEEINKILKDPPGNVKFLGIVPREKMNDLYNIADTMFLASFEELFPMTILESANCKVPILLRDIELYKGILDGYYLKGSSVDEFVGQIKKIKDEKSYYVEASKMAEECSVFYSEENVSKMWDKFYNEVYEEKSKKNWRKIRNEKYKVKKRK